MIFLAVPGSAKEAIILSRPPHSGQASTSIAKTFFSNSAHGIR
jgi:hypothetical protein